MTRGHAYSATDEQPVAISGSVVAERRRRALADGGTAVLVVDRTMRVRMASGHAAEDLPGAPLQDFIDAGPDGARLEHAMQEAQNGSRTELELQVAGNPRSVSCIPLSGDLTAGEGMAVVTIAAPPAVGNEVADLRARANDLEILAEAARRLARSSYPDEVRETVCAAAADVAGADVAALLERSADGLSFVVTAAGTDDLVDKAVPVERAAHAARAFETGRLEFTTAIGATNAASAWPLGSAGVRAGTWQPVRSGEDVAAVIAIGWRHPAPPPRERMSESLELLADETAVALERAEALQQLTGMARTDPLTELSNRRAWQDELTRELARAERSGQPLAIGLIDLDDLKVYNDHWGHAAGDRVLLTAAARWRRRLRMTDLLARIGGDEFAVTMPGCRLVEAVELGDQLRSALPDGLSCSIGVAEWSGAEAAADLLARADQALYAAKNAGRDATFSLPTPAGPRAGRPLPSQ